MKQLPTLITILIIWHLPFLTEVKANGGGFWINSPVYGVGNPVFRNIPQVSILSERLYIKCGHSHSDIKVKYVLWNSSDKDINHIDYAFPVDFARMDTDSLYNPFESYDPPVKYVEFVVDGKTHPYSTEPHVLLPPMASEDTEGRVMTDWTYRVAHELYRKWFYTQFSIKKQSFLTLEVSYSVDSPYYGDGDAPYESDPGVVNVLHYDFSPASHWGDGIIRDFYVQLDATELQLAGLSPTIATIDSDAAEARYLYDYYADKDTIYVNGLQFEGNGPVFTYHTRNFDLSKSRPLLLNYFHPSSFASLLDGYIPQNLYQLRVSTEQAKYPSSNLIDFNLESAWVPAQKGGIGDWVEFDFKEKDSLDRVIALLLVNGYQKNETTYLQNNRIKRLKATITSYSNDVDTFFISLPDVPYRLLNLTSIASYTANARSGYSTKHTPPPPPVFDLFIEERPVKTIRLTILDVYPGTKYDDTCISELILYRFGTYDRYLPAFYDRYRRE